MAWISVHESIYGPKLRGLHHLLKCSEFEAVGILMALWLWALNNAEKDGFLPHVEREDIARSLYSRASGCKNSMGEVVDALIESGWINQTERGLVIHDWDTWQEQWYKARERREKDAARKRAVRSAEPAKKPEESVKKQNRKDEEKPIIESESSSPEEPKKKPVKKVQYSDFVRMTKEEYVKLTDKLGEEFTAKCIEKLDNYKGANGKTYKDDYRAILNWVIKEVDKENPGLRLRSKPKTHSNENPFAMYMGDDEWTDLSSTT